MVSRSALGDSRNGADAGKPATTKGAPEDSEAEQQKRQRLEEMLREYRACADPKEAERLGNDLGAMIFGR